MYRHWYTHRCMRKLMKRTYKASRNYRTIDCFTALFYDRQDRDMHTRMYHNAQVCFPGKCFMSTQCI